jgi:hypothetical protein
MTFQSGGMSQEKANQGSKRGTDPIYIQAHSSRSGTAQEIEIYEPAPGPGPAPALQAKLKSEFPLTPSKAKQRYAFLARVSSHLQIQKK